MNFARTPEQELLRDPFADRFASASTPDRVRRAEETGFDGDLW